ncbi:hypothetical protein [Kitasatospora phosalacinea]|nr:hypothetical protein [Kitasatospora phosalacinea]
MLLAVGALVCATSLPRVSWAAACWWSLDYAAIGGLAAVLPRTHRR